MGERWARYPAGTRELFGAAAEKEVEEAAGGPAKAATRHSFVDLEGRRRSGSDR